MHVEVCVNNVSPWPATDLRIEIRYRDGHIDAHTRQQLAPADLLWRFTVPSVGASGSDGYDEFRRLVESVVLTYSDAREIASYERRLDADSDRVGRPKMFRDLDRQA